MVLTTMARRAIMVDVDGVLIVHPDPAGWSATLERDLGLTPTALQRDFFGPYWEDVVHGRASLRERLAPVLAVLAPTVSYEAFTRYWFANDAHVDARLLGELEQVRRDGFEVHLATVQEHERAAYLWGELGWRDRFDGLHYAAALGHAKPAAGFYCAVERATGLAPDALFFIDDREANVAAARACGWTAARWTGEDTLALLMAEAGWPGP